MAELLSEQDAEWADAAAKRLLALMRSRPESDHVMLATFMVAAARLMGRDDVAFKRKPKGETKCPCQTCAGLETTARPK